MHTPHHVTSGLNIDSDIYATYLQRQAENDAPDFTAWSDEDAILFVTVSGSRLYGFQHANSDDDYFAVTPFPRMRRKVRKQVMQGAQDAVIFDFKSFQRSAELGVPQVLEAMFSQTAESPYFEAYRQGWKANSAETVSRYCRTIKSFSLSDTNVFKYQRHALRLALNLNELLYTGRFNPSMNADEVALTAKYAAYGKAEFLRELAAISIVEMDWA